MILCLLLCSQAHALDIEFIGGDKKSYKKFSSGPTLFVNIATRCGYTGQLTDLEALYQKYKAKGLKVVGIPSNDFGGQTPEENADVKKFCRLKYGATFPIMKKAKVTGDSKHALVKKLIGSGDEIAWNFEKFLVNDNKVVARFKSGVKPKSRELTQSIEKVLKN